MGDVIFWAVFAAVLVGIGGVALYLRQKLRRFARENLGTDDFGDILNAINQESVRNEPKSVSGMDSLLLPRILEDFPDFDVHMAKTYARDHIQHQLLGKQSVIVHKIVLNDYLRTESQKTIVMQASVAYMENDHTIQTRYRLDYSFMVAAGAESVAANCPNCGAALGYGITDCPYCGSRVVNILGNTWEFTAFREI